MPRTNRRERVAGERNLYRVGEAYWASATPPGERQAQWERIGVVGIMEARRKRDEFVARVRRSETIAVSRRTKVREVADLYLAHCEQLVEARALAPRTLDSYRHGLTQHFLPDYGNRAISAVSAEDLVAWLRRQQRSEAAAWSIRNRWTPIRGLLVYATRNRMIAANPADVLTRRERPSPGESRVRFLDEDEMRTLLDVTAPRFRAAVATMLFTGLRAGEVLGLVWADVDFKAKHIRVRYQMDRNGNRAKLKSKGAAREVIMIPRLAAILRAHYDGSAWWRADDLVFTSAVGTSMTYRRLSEAMRKATAAAGLKDVSSHVLRYTFASILIYQGRDAMFVARQLGHTTPSTTWDTYVHLFNGARQADEARDQLDAEFGGLLEAPATAPDTAPELSAEGASPASLPDRLSALRERGSLSGQDIAGILGASEQTVSRWQTGKGEPQRKLGVRLQALEQLVDDLARSCRKREIRAAVLALADHRLEGLQ